jgi:hypothetical protein
MVVGIEEALHPRTTVLDVLEGTQSPGKRMRKRIWKMKKLLGFWNRTVVEKKHLLSTNLWLQERIVPVKVLDVSLRRKKKGKSLLPPFRTTSWIVRELSRMLTVR